jgi:putative nucleotidyltransferase with HDIG domain
VLNITTVRGRVERTDAIPTIPPVLKKIVKAVEDPGVSPASVSKLVSSDPALTAKILKAINAAVYGFAGNISTVRQAIMLLGLDVVKALLLGVSLFEIMEQTMVGLWKHSLGCAITAKLLANRKGDVDPDEASVAGLLHDVGKVVLGVQFPKEYEKALADACDKGLFLFDAEYEIFHMSHATAGAYFSQAWHFPKFAVDAIRYHHKPFLAKTAPVHTAAVHLADIFVKAYNMGFSGDCFVPVGHPSAWEIFDFSEEQMKEIFVEIGDMIAQVDDFFGGPDD